MRTDLVAALRHHRAGRLDKAEALYQAVLRQEPNQPEALHLLGVLLTDKGRPNDASKLISKALVHVPRFAEGHSNLGNAFRAAGQLGQAEASYRSALQINPNFAAAHSNLARVLTMRRDFGTALRHCDAALALDPQLAEAHANRAHACIGLGRPAEVEASFAEALRLRPGDVDTICALGAHLADAGRLAEARDCGERAISLRRDDPAGLCLVGAVQRRSGEVEGAITTYRHAVKVAPRAAVAWMGLGSSLRALGRFDEAAECYRRALGLDPDLAEAHRDLALMGRGEAGLEHLTRLLAAPHIPPNDRVAAGFALGKQLDDQGRFDDAFVSYAEANALFREAEAGAGRTFDPLALRAEVDRLIARFPPGKAVASPASSRSQLPVFVVGMPRTGTSLVEQILASHPSVFGAGELSAVGDIARQIPLGSGWTAEDAAPDQLPGLIEQHLERLHTLGGGRPRVVDKMPDNVFMLGLIAQLFPAARVVICSRDGRDTGLSCFFQRFSAGTQLFSYDLRWCGQRYSETMRLAEHWRRVLPLDMIDVSYETLVSDLEGQARRLIAFLDLPWDPACLAFHTTERAVLTASSWQVRQKLFVNAVGRWRNYERHLAPLLEGLSW